MGPSKLRDRIRMVGRARTAAGETSDDRRLIELKAAEISEERGRLKTLEESGALSPEDLAVEYAKTLISHCCRGGDQDRARSAQVVVDTGNMEGIGPGDIVGVLNAHTAVKGSGPKVRPEDGGPVSSYTLVIGFVPRDERVDESAFFLDEEQQRLRKRMATPHDAPFSSHALLEVETIDMTEAVNPVPTDDFLDWAKVLLERAGDPANAPLLYEPDRIASEYAELV